MTSITRLTDIGDPEKSIKTDQLQASSQLFDHSDCSLTGNPFSVVAGRSYSAKSSVSSLQSDDDDDDDDAPVLPDVDSHYGNHPIPELEQRYGPIALCSILSICICKLLRYLR